MPTEQDYQIAEMWRLRAEIIRQAAYNQLQEDIRKSRSERELNLRKAESQAVEAQILMNFWRNMVP